MKRFALRNGKGKDTGMKIRSSAPGRICLFGEHQDYLGFPVIAAAISLRMTINGVVSPTLKDQLLLELPDIGATLEFVSSDIQYAHAKDYLRSVVKVLQKKELYVPQSIRACFRGTVPIQSGTSSSAALSVAWTGFLLLAAQVAGLDTTAFLNHPATMAELAYEAEVVEFNESGGRMDQYSSAFGGIIYLDFYKKMTATPLPLSSKIKEFVLGDSGQPKDTQKTLKRVRAAQEEGFAQLAHFLPGKESVSIAYEEAEPFFPKIAGELLPYLKAALRNHQITDQAKKELLQSTPNVHHLSDLLNDHQNQLRDGLGISTAKIDAMIDASLKAGALAGKINGSGDGGCMFAFCPGKQMEVAEAITRCGGTPYIIEIGKGLEVVKLQ